MKILMTIKHVFRNLRLAAALSPVMIFIVIAAEGVQHIAEYSLGMYQSQAIFHDLENSPVRLGFAILKALIMIFACYMIAKKLANHHGLSSDHKPFRAHMIRRLWNPRLDITGLFTALLLAAPIISLHYVFSYLAMGHSAAPLILLLDSCLIGVLALVIGTSLWAGESVKPKSQFTPSRE